MDDHSSSAQFVRPRRHGQRRLDAVTAQLKAEFARLARERLLAYMPRVTASDIDKSRRAEASSGHYDMPDGVTVLCGIIGFSWMERERLRALDTVLSEAGQPDPDSPLHSFRKRILAFFRIILAHIIKLLARSLRAVLTIPLFLDGPEMSGFKHRLR
ncbi:hypothetical protein HU749_020940 [Pseudomonas ogarae]|uniref:hypothetical protein n=1 Tax=Pseudomonas ogarae (strain DSM 112162 / CECT 30235 / F113) TaxID=1114970 RepID=UPI0016470DF0|nr:hypothetical protein [Pseudomonas zarinae]QXH93298.1 hypothetical protein HU749_020940 [Pseudomonas zarinae]